MGDFFTFYSLGGRSCSARSTVTTALTGISQANGAVLEMDICCLSDSEVGRMNHYGISPNHEDHCHIDIKVAFQGLEDETYVLVPGLDGRDYITPSKTYFIRKTRSGCIDVVQRVLSNHILELKPTRF